MSQIRNTNEEGKLHVATHIAELSRLLGMIPFDGTIEIVDPVTKNAMDLSDWFNAARKSFLHLSLLIGKELDIQLR